MRQRIIGFEQDEEGFWVALLACGHRQHVRHRPPFIERPWTTTPQGRARKLGALLECALCDEEAKPR